MNKLILGISIIALSLFSCEQSPKPNLFVKGKIEGVRKATIYLQKMQDTLLVDLDSVALLGNENFELETYVEEPQLMFLYLKQFGSEEDAEYFDFFAEAGEFQFKLNAEGFNQTIAEKAPENQLKYQTYLATLKRFNDQNLDLISERIQTNENDTLAMRTLNEKYASLLRRKYLYTINYAMKNNAHEIAPFLMLSEAYDANKKFLDTVFNSLTPKVRNSKYGKELENLIELRAQEAKQQNIEVKTIDEEMDS